MRCFSCDTLIPLPDVRLDFVTHRFYCPLCWGEILEELNMIEIPEPRIETDLLILTEDDIIEEDFDEISDEEYIDTYNLTLDDE